MSYLYICSQVIEDFYWKGVHADVSEFCKRCDKCQRTNRVLHKPRAQLHPIPVTKVWHRVCIDLVGPLPETKRGNKYIITLSDYFSKWPLACETSYILARIMLSGLGHQLQLDHEIVL